MTPPEIDQLIEEGLTLYGQGDLDGALVAWEKALAVDPENPQASSYVDYVRSNYDALTGDAANDESKVPFGIDDEPYQIEILPGEIEYLQAPTEVAPVTVDEGWFMEDDNSAPRHTPEVEADEPPAVSFEDQTREYQSSNRAPASGTEAPPSLDSGRFEFITAEVTPGPVGGFASELTNLRERDTGFVKPTAKTTPPRAGSETDDPLTTLPPADLSISLSDDEPPPSATPADLLASLPTPLRGSPLDAKSGIPRTDTAELPPSLRRPAATEPAFAFPSTLTRDTVTRDFEAQKTTSATPKLSATPTRELQAGEITFGRELVTAPTRDLGLRPLGITATAASAISPDEEPTSTRRAVSAGALSGEPGEGTRFDLILPFDPIGARSAQILDEIDEGAPSSEAQEDRTRRRITTLFEKALTWSQTGELDKAVAAIDLALAEDPNTPLGQKLIHRHRDQMLNVFQAFVGDLSRQPVLARPLHELASAPISPRAAFLLSRIDGSLTLDELLDVSGMPRLEAYRYLCQLFLRGILR